jgi:hypothetical protein
MDVTHEPSSQQPCNTEEVTSKKKKRVRFSITARRYDGPDAVTEAVCVIFSTGIQTARGVHGVIKIHWKLPPSSNLPLLDSIKKRMQKKYFRFVTTGTVSFKDRGLSPKKKIEFEMVKRAFVRSIRAIRDLERHLDGHKCKKYLY